MKVAACLNAKYYSAWVQPHADKESDLQIEHGVGVKLDAMFSTFSTIPRSPSAMTRLTIAPAFWAMEYAEATNRISKVGLEAMAGPEGKRGERFRYLRSQLLLSFTWMQLSVYFLCAYSGLPQLTVQIPEGELEKPPFQYSLSQ